jgi:hypothetical protein
VDTSCDSLSLPTVSQVLALNGERGDLDGERRPPTPLLYPFWGVPDEDPSNPNSGRFERYATLGQSWFQLSDLAQAQIAVLPFDWRYAREDPEALAIAIARAEAAAHQGIPFVIFYLDDSTDTVPIDNALVLRTSMERSHGNGRDIPIPAWSEDFVERYCGGQVSLREKSATPVVGYCGYDSLCKSKNVFSQLKTNARLQLGASSWGSRLAKKIGIELVKHRLPWVYGSRIRAQTLFNLLHSSEIRCNFLLRQAMQHTDRLALSPRRQFVENMLGSDYILCTRGSGNFSYRFYETLSCGRIPVFINSDCVLPFEQWIDWKRYCVWVELEELPQLGKRIADFHSRLSPEAFCELQKACRQLWVDWLSPQGFFAQFHRYFR